MTRQTRTHVLRELRTPESGSALVMTLAVSMLLMAFAAAMLSMSHRDYASTRTGMARELAFLNAEAGIELALTELRTNVDLAEDGIGAASGVINGGAYGVTIDPAFSGPGTYTVRSVGEKGGATRGLEALAVVTTGAGIDYGIFAVQSFLAGSKFMADSYRSSLGDYAAQAVNYDALTARNYAGSSSIIECNGDITMDTGVSVHGDAHPGPGGSITATNVTGSTTPASEVRSFDPVDYAPTIAAQPAHSVGGGMTEVLNTGTYRYEDLTISSDGVLRIEGDVTLYVDDGFTINGGGSIVLAEGARVTLMHGTGQAQIAGSGLVNEGRDPADFRFYSRSPTITYSSDASFYGILYAPESLLKFNGGADVYGAIVTRAAELKGTGSFHYDQDLAGGGGGTQNAVTVSMLREVRP